MSEPTLWWYRPSKPILKALVPAGGGLPEGVASGNSTGATLRAWEAECASRGLAFANPLREFHHQACMALPEAQRASRCSWLDGDAPARLRAPRLLGLDDVLGFFRKTWAWWRSGETVEQAEAEKRAAVCASCPLNVRASLGGCVACTGMASDVASGIFGFVGNRRTAADGMMEHCGVCGCSLKVIVWAPLDALRAGRGDLVGDFPEWCWQK